MVFAAANVLVAGARGRCLALRRLPVRLLVMDTAVEAVRCLRTEQIDLVISNWDLAGVAGDGFLARLMAASPFMPTVVFVRPWDHVREIAARRLGASAVLSDDIDDRYFCLTVRQLLAARGLLKNGPVNFAGLAAAGRRDEIWRSLK